VVDRLVNKAAAVAVLRHPINQLQRFPQAR
jgi:hypothetical protein